MKPSTRTLLMGIFVVADRELTATQVIALAKPLRLSASNVKSHLTRMVAEGVLIRSGPARLATYRPSSGREDLIAGLKDRLQPPSRSRWDGSWLMVTVPSTLDRTHRDQIRNMLWFDGFRPLDPGLFVRPAWPLPWALERAGRHAAACGGICLRGVPVQSAFEIDSLYALQDLDRQASVLAERIQAITAALQGVEEANRGQRAFSQRLKVGHDAIQLIAHDPRLPAELWGKRRGLQKLAQAFSNFERVLGAHSDEFLEEVGRE